MHWTALAEPKWDMFHRYHKAIVWQKTPATMTPIRTTRESPNEYQDLFTSQLGTAIYVIQVGVHHQDSVKAGYLSTRCISYMQHLLKEGAEWTNSILSYPGATYIPVERISSTAF